MLLKYFAAPFLWAASILKPLLDELRKPLQNPFDDGPDGYA